MTNGGSTFDGAKVLSFGNRGELVCLLHGRKISFNDATFLAMRLNPLLSTSMSRGLAGGEVARIQGRI
jgi:hypothetical protein